MRLRTPLATIRREAKDPAQGVARANGTRPRRDKPGLGPLSRTVGRVSEAPPMAARRRPVPAASWPATAAPNRAGGTGPTPRIGGTQALSLAERPVGPRPLRQAVAQPVARAPARLVPAPRAALAPPVTVPGVEIGPGATGRPLSGPPVVGVSLQLGPPDRARNVRCGAPKPRRRGGEFPRKGVRLPHKKSSG